MGGVMMQIQKGLVKYKDRSDIICTYGITDDGGQYYFLDGNRLTNGNIIATTVLVEAIDSSVVPSSIGVIDQDGNVIIPFKNKSIRAISDDILLVEKAKPTTESVIDALKLRSDPLAATKLVTTPATIKDKMNAKMGSDGRFVFNDQFSEATVYDISGNNLIDGDYFSFIGMTKDKLYFSKNTVDSIISEYSLLPPKVQANIGEDVNVTSKLDVSNAVLSKDIIDSAINEQMEQQKMEQEEKNNIVEEESNTNIFDEVKNESFEEKLDTNIKEDNSIEFSVVDTKDENVDKNKNDYDLKKVNDDSLTLDVADNNVVIDEEKESDDSILDVGSIFDEKLDKDLDKQDDSDKYKEDLSFITDDSMDDSDMDLDLGVSFDSVLKEDNIFSDNDYIDNYNPNTPVKDTIIEDVAVTMSNLIKLNRNQRKKIGVYEGQIEQLMSNNKKLIQKAKSQSREIETLKNRVSNYEKIVSKLEARNQILDNKIHEQERVISAQNDELNTLRPQVEGKKDLVRLLEDAQSLFATSDKDDGYNKNIVA